MKTQPTQKGLLITHTLVAHPQDQLASLRIATIEQAKPYLVPILKESFVQTLHEIDGLIYRGRSRLVSGVAGHGQRCAESALLAIRHFYADEFLIHLRRLAQDEITDNDANLVRREVAKFMRSIERHQFKALDRGILGDALTMAKARESPALRRPHD